MLQEAWSGRKPGISHLIVFGSIAYVHVPNEMRNKLNNKSEKLVFTGYDTYSKGYKLYNPKNGKIVINHDVEFDEESSWDWDVQEENYEFFPYFDEEKEHPMIEQVTKEQATPPASPIRTGDGDSTISYWEE